MTPEEQDQVKKAIAVLTSLLDKESNVAPFPIWKTINLSTYSKADKLIEDLKKSGSSITLSAKELLEKVPLGIARNTFINLVKVTAAELGFKYRATTHEIYEAAREHGLELCPAEVGPQLRLQYADQPMNELLLVGMEPIAGSDSLYVFSIENGRGVQWLAALYNNPSGGWGINSPWVFVRR